MLITTSPEIKQPTSWLTRLAALRGAAAIMPLQQAVTFYTKNMMQLLAKGIRMADILLALNVDNDTLLAALLYPAYQANQQVSEMFDLAQGCPAYQLLQDIVHIQSLQSMCISTAQRNHRQLENMRKMLLAIVHDVRAVLIILAEHLWQLEASQHAEPASAQQLSQKTLNIYAPLASRLGVWQLKWQMEDLAFSYLQPAIYADIRSQLKPRHEYEQAIHAMTMDLNKRLASTRLRGFAVHGRVKHIYSIYRKMQRKSIALHRIYDMLALRVLVNSLDDCYTSLGVIQQLWPQLPDEFDDYIMHPKENGYRSIHALVQIPHEQWVEIQVRTYAMHQENELGVAAHWCYKEGILQTSHYEAKIALLRQIMAWQHDLLAERIVSHEATVATLTDRLYVFTPANDIVELPQGATPLDFAYYIHSDIGHHCRGAKVNGRMVPLGYVLKTGDRVEILTVQHAMPSRDWLNKAQGYLTTRRACCKVRHWFRAQDEHDR